MMRSGYDWLNSHDLRCRRNDVNDWADVVSTGRAFQMRRAATEKARLPTVETREPDGRHQERWKSVQKVAGISQKTIFYYFLVINWSVQVVVWSHRLLRWLCRHYR